MAERGDAAAGMTELRARSSPHTLSAAQERPVSVTRPAAALQEHGDDRRVSRRRDESAPRPTAETGRGRRQSTPPARHHRARQSIGPDALAGLNGGKARHPEAVDRLHVDDVLIDTDAWSLEHVDAHPSNLRHVPEGERPT